MKIKLFENFQSDSPEFTQSIGRREQDVYLSIYREPGDSKGLGLASGKCKWKMKLVADQSGYAVVEPKLTYLYFVADYEEEETEEIKEKEFEIYEKDFDYELMEYEIKGFPFYLTYITVDMNHTYDPEFWKIEIEIGPRKEY